ncbi:MAG: creatininase family protein [Patescibacteria group bacterium]
MVYRLDKWTWQETAKYLTDDDRVILPIGSNEQHGPIGELGTDSVLAMWAAELVSREFSVPIAPLVPYGMSSHHTCFAGTVSLTDVTLIALISEIVESLYRHGFRHILIINGHGGNSRPLTYAVETLNRRYSDLRVFNDPFCPLFYVETGELADVFRSFGDGVSHACAAEISLYHAIIESDFRDRSFITDESVTLGVHGQGTQGADPENFATLFPSGSKGDQRLADINIGRAIKQLMGAELIKQVQKLW